MAEPAVAGDRATSAAGDDKSPAGLLGWLRVAAVALFVSPFIGFFTLSMYGLVLRMANPTGSQLLVIQAHLGAAFVVFGLLPLVLLGFFFKRSRRFPKVYIFWVWLLVAFVCVDAFVVEPVFAEFWNRLLEKPQMDLPYFKIFVWVALAGTWTGYMLQSRRVENTFVN